MKTNRSQTPTPERSDLTQRYVHAVTRTLPEDQRADVAEELRASITDRVESLQHSSGLSAQQALSHQQAEYAALEELGDPDQLAAGYTGRRLQLIGPESYPAYIRVLKAILVTVVPIVTVVVAIIEAATGSSIGGVIGGAVWMAFAVGVQISFWVTLAFALAERGLSTEDLRSSMNPEWSPDQLPELPHGAREGIGELVTNLVWLGLLGGAIIWQGVSSPIHDAGERLPILDPDLWSFWLPLVLALLVVEMGFEVVKYRIGGWTTPLATANVVLGAVFAAPIVYLASTDRLLNPAVVTEIQAGWPEFDPGYAHTVVLVVALLIWLWDSVDGWRKALHNQVPAPMAA